VRSTLFRITLVGNVIAFFLLAILGVWEVLPQPLWGRLLLTNILFATIPAALWPWEEKQ
jgi:hypothetical protein